MRSGVAVLVGAGLRGRRKGGLVATFAVLVLASIAIATGLVVARQGAPLLDEVAEEANVAHLVLYGDDEAITAAAEEADVVESSGPFSALSGLELVLPGGTVPTELTALDSPEIAVNRTPMRNGRWVEGAGEVVLDHSVSSDLGIDIGDEVTLRLAEDEVTYAVVGTAVGLTDCFYPQCEPARMWVTVSGLERFAAADRVYSVGYLRFADAVDADPFVERRAAAGETGIEGTNSWVDTRGDFLVLDNVFGSFVAAFGGFVLVVAAVIIAGSTAMRIVTQRRTIALMGAIGSTPRQIMASLVLENLALGAVAAVLGWFAAGFLAPSFQLGIGRTLGPQDPTWSTFALVACLVVIGVLLGAATVVPARTASARPVTDVLRDVPPGRVSWFNRHANHVPARLSLLGAQEAASQPVRSGLAALAIGVALVGTVVSAGMISGIDLVTSEADRAGDPWDIALIDPAADVDRVEAVLGDSPDVAGWFTEVPRRSTYRDGAFLSVAIGGDPASAAFWIAEGRGLQEAGDAIVGYGFMQRFGVSVGDRIDFLAGTTPINVEVVGWYRDTEDSGEILRYRFEDLAAADPTATPEIHRVTLVDGGDAKIVAAALAEAVGRDARVELLDTGRDDLEPVMVVLRSVALVLFVTAGVNLLSTLLTASRESARRIGVEKAMGFTPRQLIAQGAVAGTVLGIVAVIVGIPLGLVVFRILADAVSSGIGVGPGWLPAPSISTIAIVGLIAVGLSAALGAAAERRQATVPAADLVRDT